jgi:hypothetical protein
VLKTIVYQFF